MIPDVHIAMKMPSSFGFTALRSMTIDGSESVVTAIIKAPRQAMRLWQAEPPQSG